MPQPAEKSQILIVFGWCTAWLDDHTALGPHRRHGWCDDPVAGIGLIFRDARILTADFDARPASDLNANDIVQSNGLVDRAQIVKAVGTKRADTQSEIDLCERSHGDGHKVLILTSAQKFWAEN